MAAPHSPRGNWVRVAARRAVPVHRLPTGRKSMEGSPERGGVRQQWLSADDTSKRHARRRTADEPDKQRGWCRGVGFNLKHSLSHVVSTRITPRLARPPTEQVTDKSTLEASPRHLPTHYPRLTFRLSTRRVHAAPGGTRLAPARAGSNSLRLSGRRRQARKRGYFATQKAS